MSDFFFKFEEFERLGGHRHLFECLTGSAKLL